MAGGLLGGLLLGGGLAAINNGLASWRESEARADNYYYNELAARNADERTRKLYTDLQSPSALLHQYREAGLSPSLMFSGSGIGGQTTQGAQGSGAAGISPTTAPMGAQDMANLELTKATAEKTRAEAETIKGENKRGEAEIAQIIQNTNNMWLEGENKALENTLKQIEVSLKGEYGEEQVKADLAKATLEAESLRTTLRSLVAKAKIDEESANAIIEYHKNRVIEQQAEIFLKRSQTELNKAGIALTNTQAQKLLNDILVDNENIEIKKGHLKLDQDKLNAQIEQWGVENGIANRAQNIEIAKMIVKFITDNNGNAIQLINALIPL